MSEMTELTENDKIGKNDKTNKSGEILQKITKV